MGDRVVNCSACTARLKVKSGSEAAVITCPRCGAMVRTGRGATSDSRSRDGATMRPRSETPPANTRRTSSGNNERSRHANSGTQSVSSISPKLGILIGGGIGFIILFGIWAVVWRNQTSSQPVAALTQEKNPDFADATAGPGSVVSEVPIRETGRQTDGVASQAEFANSSSAGAPNVVSSHPGDRTPPAQDSPVPADVLRYKWQPQQRYRYDLTMTATYPDSKFTVTGQTIYTVLSVVPSDRTDQAGLVTMDFTTEFEELLGPLEGNVVAHKMTIPESGTLEVTASGEVTRFEKGQVQLPFALGLGSLFLFEPLHGAGEDRWDVTTNTQLVFLLNQSGAVINGGMPFHGARKPVFWEDVGAVPNGRHPAWARPPGVVFMPPMPANIPKIAIPKMPALPPHVSAGIVDENSVSMKVLSASERREMRIIHTDPNKTLIEKTVEFAPGLGGSHSMLHCWMKGTVTFDRTLGLPTTTEMGGLFTDLQKPENKPVEFHVTGKLQLETGAGSAP